MDLIYIIDNNEITKNYFTELAYKSKENLKNALNSNDTVNAGKNKDISCIMSR